MVVKQVTAGAKAVCGCLGSVVHISQGGKHGGSVHVKVTRPCPGGHPQHLPRIGVGVIEHFRTDQIEAMV